MQRAAPVEPNRRPPHSKLSTQGECCGPAKVLCSIPFLFYFLFVHRFPGFTQRLMIRWASRCRSVSKPQYFSTQIFQFLSVYYLPIRLSGFKQIVVLQSVLPSVHLSANPNIWNFVTESILVKNKVQENRTHPGVASKSKSDDRLVCGR